MGHEIERKFLVDGDFKSQAVAQQKIVQGYLSTVPEGLVVAEVELGAEDEAFDKPEWLGDEVTGDRRYYNARLMRKPYKNW